MTWIYPFSKTQSLLHQTASINRHPPRFSDATSPHRTAKALRWKFAFSLSALLIGEPPFSYQRIQTHPLFCQRSSTAHETFFFGSVSIFLRHHLIRHHREHGSLQGRGHLRQRLLSDCG